MAQRWWDASFEEIAAQIPKITKSLLLSRVQFSSYNLLSDVREPIPGGKDPVNMFPLKSLKSTKIKAVKHENNSSLQVFEVW